MQMKIIKNRPTDGPNSTNLPIAFFLFNVCQAFAILMIALFVELNNDLLLLIALGFLNITGIISVLTYIGFKFKWK